MTANRSRSPSTLEDIPEPVAKYLRTTREQACNKLTELIENSNLGFTQAPYINKFKDRFTCLVSFQIAGKLEGFLVLMIVGAEDELNDLHFKRMHEVKSLCKNMELSEATKATAEVPKKVRKKDNNIIEEVLDDACS